MSKMAVHPIDIAAQATQKQEFNKPWSGDIEQMSERLNQCFKSYMRKEIFEVGNFVQWSAGLRNRQSPMYGQPAVVLEIAYGEHSKNVSQGAFKPEVGDALDMRIGVIDEALGVFVSFWVDSSRFDFFMAGSAQDFGEDA